MSLTDTGFGMHRDCPEELKYRFDDAFEERGGALRSWSPFDYTGSCICSLGCSDCSCGC